MIYKNEHQWQPMVIQEPIGRAFKHGGQISLADTVITEQTIQVLVYDHLPDFAQLTPNWGKPTLRQSLNCSPCDIHSLIVGNLYTEGLISNLAQIKKLYIEPRGKFAFVEATLNPPNIKALPQIPVTDLNYSHIFAQAEHLNRHCDLFYETGALHTSSLWFDGAPAYLSSDLGRHNTIDKVVGQALLEGRNFRHAVLYTSGRLPANMVQKVAFAQIPVVASRSAPTAQSIGLAQQMGITLLGFVGQKRLNQYSQQSR